MDPELLLPRLVVEVNVLLADVVDVAVVVRDVLARRNMSPGEKALAAARSGLENDFVAQKTMVECIDCVKAKGC